MSHLKETLRILLVDDHPLVIEGIKTCLRAVSRIEVVGDACDGEDALRKARLLLPDVVLADITMPVMNGLELTRHLMAEFPGMKVLVLTVHDSRESILQILQAGAKGYILKDSTPHEVIEAIEAVGRGERFFSPLVSRILVDDYLRQLGPEPESPRDEDADTARKANAKLTQREEDVLALIAACLSNKEIAHHLGLSIKTVMCHRNNLRKKLNLSGAALTRYALARKRQEEV